MSESIKIHSMIKIYTHGVYPYFIEDNMYIGTRMGAEAMQWHKIWYAKYGLCRKNGPAMHTIDYSAEMWYTDLFKGRHRLDGPQTIYTTGDEEYWVDNKYICDNLEDFEKWKKIQILS